LAAIALTPFAAAWRGHTLTEVVALIAMAVLIIYAHRSNLREFRSGIGKLSTTGHQEPAR
jgi:hypothetical protein